MVTELMVALKVQLVLDNIMGLQLWESGEVALGKLEFEYWQVLADLSEGPHFDFFQPGHNFSYELGDEKSAGSGVTKMGPYRFLAEFLNHDRYTSIKPARVSEKLFNVDLSLAIKRVNVV